MSDNSATYPMDDEVEEEEGSEPEAKKALEGLIRDLSNEPKDTILSGDQKLRQKYKPKVLSIIQLRTPDVAVAKFVSDVLEISFIYVDGSQILFPKTHKTFLLEIAIPENWKQLGYQPTGSKEPTPLHMAIKEDITAHKSEVVFFMPFFCKLMEGAIKSGDLPKEEAANIISKTNAKEETCLHLALMNDLDVAETLIRLADDVTFEQKRENGNTPLHDALEFPTEPKQARLRYLVQTPKCKTPSLLTPMHEFNQLGDKTPPSSCCIQCQRADIKYGKLKERRSKIICELLRKCPAALAIQNKEGKSPFSYHVMAREEFRKKNPNLTTQRRPTNLPSGIGLGGAARLGAPLAQASPAGINTVSGNQDAGPAPLGDVNTANGESLNSLVAGARRANVGTLRFHNKSSPSSQEVGASLVAPSNTAQDLAGREGAQGAHKIEEDCSPSSPRDWYQLSVEVEELLWEAAFCIGGYEKARQCIFWSRDTKSESQSRHGLLCPLKPAICRRCTKVFIWALPYDRTC
jgi:hypothetical protein